MFNEQFVRDLLEKIGGNSATLVLNNAGECVFASSVVKTVLNVEPSDLVGKVFVDVVPLYTLEPKLVEEHHNPIAKSVKQKNFVQSTPFFCKLSNDPDAGTLALTSIQLMDGEKINAVVIQIRKAKREVDVGEMKTLFLSFAAHQLKTPSSIVKGFLELMMRQGEAAYSKEQWHFLTSAFESNENLIAVSKTLLNMTRLEGGLIEPNINAFDPSRALQGKVASFAALYKTKRLSINFSVSQEENTNTLRSDESFFLEVFGIILGNAIKHSPIGANITVSCILNDTHCEVHVIDEGPGIPTATKDQLFKFKQDSSEEENSHGLGLYMAKKYITLLGGTLGVADSEFGSDFYYTVPNAVI